MSVDNQIEYIEREELERLQFLRLRKTLERVYENSPFYRKMFRERGLNPSEFKFLKEEITSPTGS